MASTEARRRLSARICPGADTHWPVSHTAEQPLSRPPCPQREESYFSRAEPDRGLVDRRGLGLERGSDSRAIFLDLEADPLLAPSQSIAHELCDHHGKSFPAVMGLDGDSRSPREHGI